ncbi:signal peptidase I [Nitrogeniibacter mangrovi]|uniref:Signal peptidase I n=1 Tax=Nitrogeniibacter mangrovi TaxID=2016596 RepID=A0A6C1B648_9RHOO|nr:signal peptidase I [Nitrogeniibacter mangrovi]QID17770.1 signal peptidase I [Nitrogeniibacter mangrovi]
MNFALILFLLLVATGLLWLVDKLYAKKRRAKDAVDPWWVEYGASFFPVILAVFFLRSFLVEPFKIPSGSMIPTLLVGDYILVNKFTYGIRLPVINKKVIALNEPQRGDVMVFRYPDNPELDYIKRVVGLPGDTVEYFGKRLKINGKPVDTNADGEYLHRDRLYSSQRFMEHLGNVTHEILNDNDKPPFVPQVKAFPQRDHCTYTSGGVRCVVPEGHYFVMGDNRDDSSDSRVWGFVPEENIVGKAFFIWFNFNDLSRIGSFH